MMTVPCSYTSSLITDGSNGFGMKVKYDPLTHEQFVWLMQGLSIYQTKAIKKRKVSIDFV